MNTASHYQLYVIGGSQADDYHHDKLGMWTEAIVLYGRGISSNDVSRIQRSR
jgi:hypothetical protein